MGTVAECCTHLLGRHVCALVALAVALREVRRWAGMRRSGLQSALMVSGRVNGQERNIWANLCMVVKTALQSVLHCPIMAGVADMRAWRRAWCSTGQATWTSAGATWAT